MNLKGHIIRFISIYQYPQFLFAKSVKKNLNKMLPKATEKNIFDVPCGNGSISYNISKQKKTTVFGYDLSSESIDFAKANFKANNLHFQIADINELFSKKISANAICIINSLFLLPNLNLLFENFKKNTDQNTLLLCIIPNKESKNYQTFVKANPTINLIEYSFEEAKHYFNTMGFNIIHSESTIYARPYFRKEAKIFGVFLPFYLLLLNLVLSILKKSSPNYFLFVLSKKSGRKDEPTQ